MAGEGEIWDGKEWEAHVLHLLQAEHGAHNVQKVPAKHQGDCGLDYFCLTELIVYQCYACEEPVDVATRAAKQKIKITTDIRKFCDTGNGAAMLFKYHKIKRWILAVPLHDSKDVVLHAAKKAAEVRAKGLTYVSDDFQIVIQDRENFDSDTWRRRMVLRKQIRPILIDPTKADIAAVADGDQNLTGNLRKKLGKRVSDTSDLEDAVDDAIQVFVESENAKDALRTISPDAYEDIVRLISERLRRIRLGSRASGSDCLDAEINGLKESILTSVPNLHSGTAETIAVGSVTEWLMRCPLRLD